MAEIIPKPENVAQLIYLLRGEKVMLDAELARLYAVPTKALNQAVKRNRDRFAKASRSSFTPLRLHRARRRHA
jgi:hypothetical protein